jgi:predicted DNA-binding protein YlxM (UPF0122 family)
MAKVHIDLSTLPARQTLSEQQGSSAVYAQLIDLLRARVSILSGKDRVLMQMYLESGLTFGRMARVAGVNEATIARRIHKLTCLLLDSEYITCLRNRRRFSSLELLIARDHYFDDLGHKKIAKRRNVTVYQVRKTLRKIQELDRVLNNQNRIRHETKVRSEKELSMVGSTDRKSG